MRRSTPLTWEQARVGLLLLAALVALAAGVFYVGSTGHVFGERFRLVTLMRSASGLAPGASVQLAGQNVGQVAGVRLIPPEERPESGQAVAVTLAVNRAVAEQIRTDSRAHIQTQGLLGDRLINISPGSLDAPTLSPGDTLESVEPLDYQQVLNEASGAVSNLTSITRDLSGLTERIARGEGTAGRLLLDPALYRRMVSLSGTLDSTLTAVNRGDGGTLSQLLHDDALYRRMVASAASLDSITSRVSRGEGSLGRMVASDSLYRSVAGAAGRADSLLRLVVQGEGAAGRMITQDSVYDELLRTLVDLNATLDELRENPRRFIPPVSVF